MLPPPSGAVRERRGKPPRRVLVPLAAVLIAYLLVALSPTCQLVLRRRPGAVRVVLPGRPRDRWAPTVMRMAEDTCEVYVGFDLQNEPSGTPREGSVIVNVCTGAVRTAEERPIEWRRAFLAHPPGRTIPRSRLVGLSFPHPYPSEPTGFVSLPGLSWEWYGVGWEDILGGDARSGVAVSRLAWMTSGQARNAWALVDPLHREAGFLSPAGRNWELWLWPERRPPTPPAWTSSNGLMLWVGIVDDATGAVIPGARITDLGSGVSTPLDRIISWGTFDTRIRMRAEHAGYAPRVDSLTLVVGRPDTLLLRLSRRKGAQRR